MEDTLLKVCGRRAKHKTTFSVTNEYTQNGTCYINRSGAGILTEKSHYSYACTNITILKDGLHCDLVVALKSCGTQLHD